MPETRLLFDEFGQPAAFVVDMRFEVSGQEYMAVLKADDIARDPLFLRVEVDNEGREMLTLPLFGEREEILKTYQSLARTYH